MRNNNYFYFSACFISFLCKLHLLHERIEWSNREMRYINKAVLLLYYSFNAKVR